MTLYSGFPSHIARKWCRGSTFLLFRTHFELGSKLALRIMKLATDMGINNWMLDIS